MPAITVANAGAGGAAAEPAGRSRTTARQSAVPASVTRPTPQNAPRQPTPVTSAASGSVETSAPKMPAVALSAASNPNRAGGNQAAAILSVPMNVALAPAPTSSRPANSIGVAVAPPMTRAPTPMTAPPAVSTRRAPKASSRSPAGTISAA